MRTVALGRKGVLSWRTSGRAHSGTQKEGCAFMAHLRACAQRHSEERVCFHGAPQGMRTVALKRKGVLSWRTSGPAHSGTQKEGCAFMAHLRACAQWHSEGRVCFHGAPQGVRTATLRRKGVLSWRTSGRAHSGTQKEGCAFMAHLRACAQRHSEGRVCFHGAPQGAQRTQVLLARNLSTLGCRITQPPNVRCHIHGCPF